MGFDGKEGGWFNRSKYREDAALFKSVTHLDVLACAITS